MSKRATNYMWTLNNYSPEEEQTIRDIVCKYMSFGYETGKENGVPHLQGATVFNTKKSLSQVIKIFPTRVSSIQEIIHLQDAIDYTQKDMEFYESGDRPVSNKRKGEIEKDRYDDAKKKAKLGDLDSIDADIYLRMYRTLKEIAKDHMIKPLSLDALGNRWVCGPSGCGKSRQARLDYPGAYYKMCNKWWDGYQGEETVIIEDIDENHKCLVHHLKIWGDHGPFLAETKGGAINIRPKRIIVTSNIRLSEIAEGVHLEALERRYEVTDHFDPSYSSNFKQKIKNVI